MNANQITEILTCPDCEGSGTVIALMKPVRGPCYHEAIPCSGCGGTGTFTNVAAAARAEGKRLHEARRALGLSLRDIEQMAGIPAQVVTALEHGEARVGAACAGDLAAVLYALAHDRARAGRQNRG